MKEVIGGRLAAEALAAREVEYVFTLSGGHITPIYQFLEESGITIFDTRHEQAAVFMAEAWARMTRKPAVALVTAGPGFTNALTGIANARLANAPVILISGAVGLSSCEKLDLQDMNQLPAITPMVKKALVCHNAERIPEFIDRAFCIASSGRPGPVYLELPCDILNAEIDPTKVRRPHTTAESRPVDIAGAHKLVKLLEQAEKPLVIAGTGSWYADAGPELTEFIEKTGVPLFTLAGGRGVVSDTHPLCFESGLAIRPGAAFVANVSADLVVLLGSRLGLYYLFGDIFPPDATIVQVDIEPEEIGRNRSVQLGIASDIKALLQEINRIVNEKNNGAAFKARFGQWVETIRQADIDGKAPSWPLWESPNVPIHPLRLAHEINAYLDRKDDMVIADGGDTQVWMGMTRTVQEGGSYLDSGLYGCLGVGIPFANAAKLMHPERRVLLVIGDGSVGFNFMEFHTALRRGLPVVVVVANDESWGMIAHSQTLRLGQPIKDGTHLGMVHYEKMVAALGGFGVCVERPEDIRPALDAAFQSGRTACINVMIDPGVISPGSVALANLGGYKAG